MKRNRTYFIYLLLVFVACKEEQAQLNKAQKTDIELLGIETDVTFPFQNIDKRKDVSTLGNEKEIRNLSFNLLSRAHKFPFQIIDYSYPIGLFDLADFVLNGNCHGGEHVHYFYKDVVIFIEKGAKLSDLLILEQALRLNNRIHTFTLVTKATSVGNYKVIVDKRKTFANDLRMIPKLIEKNALDRGEPLPLPETLPPQPPPRPIDYKRGIEHYIETKNGKIILIENLKHYEVEKNNILKEEKEFILKLSTKMSLEDYLLVLKDIQAIRNGGKELLVHIME